MTVNNTNAVQIATLTGIDANRGIVYLDGAVYTVDSENVDFGEGVKIDDSVKIWSTSGRNVYTYKIFTMEELATLYELAQDNGITLEAAVGTYVSEDGNLQIAWILIDNYYYVTSGTTETLTQTVDIIARLD